MDVPKTQCCIAGGGPAGLMLGYLLARAGVRVTVLEKHGDFLRDFRGDTIHPSTMQIMHDLGLLDAFLRLPHARFDTMGFDFDGDFVTVADFSALNVAAPFVAMMPQWDFLDFIADRGRELPGFDLRMNCEATGLVRDGGRIVGVTANGPRGPLRIEAGLTVAADGRHSRLRGAAGLVPQVFGSPIDVLWYRLSRRSGDTDGSLGRIRGGRIVVMLNRGSYWQCASVVAKGGADAIRARGLDDFRGRIALTTGLGPERAAEIQSWDAVKVLDVRIDRLRRWAVDGFLAIGDAAHAMSPVGGVGVNLAIQDAVAAANLLHAGLKGGAVTLPDLDAVQERRELPVRVTQFLQRQIQDRIIVPSLDVQRPESLPLPFRLLKGAPWLQRFPARFIGLGLRTERPDPGLG